MTRVQAAEAIAGMGPQAESAVPKMLAAAAREGQYWYLLIRPIAKIGEPAVPHLIAAFGADDPKLRMAAVESLIRIGDPAIGPLTDAVRASSTRTRGWAAATLGQMGTRASPAAEALRTAVDDADEVVRVLAAGAWKRVAPSEPCEKGMAVLVEALSSEDVEARDCAASSLGAYGPPAVQPLLPLVGDENDKVRLSAATALGRIGKAAVPALVKALADQDTNVRESAAVGLFNVGPEARAIGPLRAALKDASPRVRSTAVMALASVCQPRDKAVKDILPLLEDADPTVRAAAVSALGFTESKASKVKRALEKATKDPDPKVRTRAERELSRSKRDE